MTSEPLRDGPAVHGAQGDRLEDQQVEGAWGRSRWSVTAFPLRFDRNKPITAHVEVQGVDRTGAHPGTATATCYSSSVLRPRQCLPGTCHDANALRRSAAARWPWPLFCSAAAEASTNPRTRWPSSSNAFEELRVQSRIPAITAVITRGQDVVWVRAPGTADLATGRLATDTTVYHLASITKPFASVVLLQLVQEGEALARRSRLEVRRRPAELRNGAGASSPEPHLGGDPGNDVPVQRGPLCASGHGRRTDRRQVVRRGASGADCRHARAEAHRS